MAITQRFLRAPTRESATARLILLNQRSEHLHQWREFTGFICATSIEQTIEHLHGMSVFVRGGNGMQRDFGHERLQMADQFPNFVFSKNCGFHLSSSFA